MDSVALTTYLETEWAEVLAETGITAAYIVAVVEEHYLADTTLDDAYAESLADYYLLRRAVRSVAPEFDLSRQGGSLSLGKRVDRWKAWLDEAAAKVGWIVDPSGARRGRVVTVVGDYLTGSDPDGST